MAAYQINEKVSVRKEPSLTSTIVGSCDKGQIVDVDQEISGWRHVSNGWIPVAIQPSTGGNPVSTGTKVETSEAKTDVGTIVTFDKDQTYTDLAGKKLPKQATITGTKEDGKVIVLSDGTNTYQVDKGMIKTTSSNGMVVVPADMATGGKNETPASEKITEYVDKLASTVEDYVQKFASNFGDKKPTIKPTELKIKNMKGVLGMPYQFSHWVDPRPNSQADSDSNGNDIEPGVVFADRILARSPLLVLIPGSAEFMPDGSSEEKKNMLKVLNDDLGGISKEGKETLETQLMNKPMKYYGLTPDYTSYYEFYVNPMLNAMAQFLEIDSYVYFGTKLGEYNWFKNVPSENQCFLSCYLGGVSLYINADSSFSEGFSNSTNPSTVLSKIKGISDIGREINFLFGKNSNLPGLTRDEIAKAGKDGEANKVASEHMENAATTGQGIIGAITSGLSTSVTTGSRLSFPEIWADSNYSRDYNISIKLVSPDNDVTSIYLNILVPLVHLIALAAPHNVNVNGYTSPFLVRAFYKGIFHCPMGIITSLSFTKGGEGNWTQCGLPTVVDVSLSIRELHSTMSIGGAKFGLFCNTTQLDYLANLCGIVIHEPDLKRHLQYLNTMQGTGALTRSLRYMPETIFQNISNMIKQRLGTTR